MFVSEMFHNQILACDHNYFYYYFSFLERWAGDDGPSDAFSHDFEPLFGVEVIPVAMQERAKPIIGSLCQGFLAVMNLQLVDFLPNGKYHAVQDPVLRDKLSHSKLTNITGGEQCFGDLDFSLFKRRNASIHHLSTLNMLNRNWTISSFMFTLI